MVYKQQNFVENLQNGIRYQDFDAITDAIAPEVGILAHEDKPALIRAVQAGGIDIPNNIEDTPLFKVVISNLFKGNEKVIGKVLGAILVNKEKNEAGSYSNADTASAAMEMVGGLANLGASVSNTIGAEKTAASNVTAAKEGVKGKMLDALGKIQDAKSTAAQTAMGAKIASQQSNNTLTYVVVTAVVGLTVFVLWKTGVFSSGSGGGSAPSAPAPAPAK